MEDVRESDPQDPSPASANPSPEAYAEPARERSQSDSLDSMRPPSPEVYDGGFDAGYEGGFSEPPSAFDEPGIDRVLEIPLTIHVELGRKRVKIRELMQVGAGTVLTLDAQAGASLAIYANQTLIAEGEAVVVGERYGVRVTDIVSPAERVRRLGGDDR